MSDAILVDKQSSGITTVTFNRPDKHNAFSFDAWGLLGDIALDLGADDSVKVVVFTPLSLSKANGVISRRSALVGNAAHGLHPVAAQGFNLGLRDVAALCDCIADARGSDGSIDPGNPDILLSYMKWRRSDQSKLVYLTDGLVRLFGSTRPPVRTLRNLGMLGFDLIPGVRSLFARHTMGLAGRLPRLSRGVPLE